MSVVDRTCVDCGKFSLGDVQLTLTDTKPRCGKCKGQHFDKTLEDYGDRLAANRKKLLLIVEEP